MRRTINRKRNPSSSGYQEDGSWKSVGLQMISHDEVSSSIILWHPSVFQVDKKSFTKPNRVRKSWVPYTLCSVFEFFILSLGCDVFPPQVHDLVSVNVGACYPPKFQD